MCYFNLIEFWKSISMENGDGSKETSNAFHMNNLFMKETIENGVKRCQIRHVKSEIR